jgi:ABC-type transport system involved in multi-copper enzyme maturation permease subunit
MRQISLTRKLWLTVLILIAPSVLLLVIRNVAPPINNPRELWEMYSVSAHFLLASVLVPLVCMVHGTSLIAADVEAGTIAYLTTRRMRRATVLLVKFAATGLTLALLCDLAMVSFHLCALAGRDVPSLVAQSSYADWSVTRDLYYHLLIIPLTVLAFLAIFTLIGLLTARPLAVSVFYLVVVELILSNIPVHARVYSLSHHLRVTVAGVMPRIVGLFELPRTLRDELYPEGITALPELFGIVLVALVLCAGLMTTRELTSTKVVRE